MGCDFSTPSSSSNEPLLSSSLNNQQQQQEQQNKLILVGNISVGKSSLVTNLLKKPFMEEHRSTIGSAFASIDIDLPNDDNESSPNQKVNLKVWDTAGEERFRSMTKHFYRQTQVAILVFDVTNKESLENLRSWQKDISETCPTANFIIVGNKIDFTENRIVNSDDAKSVANELNAEYVETSAKTGEGVLELFQLAAKISIKSHQNSQ